MGDKVLVIGGGGREHAIIWKLSQSTKITSIFAAPGSHAIGKVPKTQNVELDITKFKQVGEWCKNNAISVVIVGPEDPLVNGIQDELSRYNIPVFGPSKAGARIESDKEWSKDFMNQCGIPTARWKSFSNPQRAKDFIVNAPFKALVVKANGLATGKGVVVAEDIFEAYTAVDTIMVDRKFGNAGNTVVIEELLEGEEISVLAFCDGHLAVPMLPAQDHKRLLNNDRGPNTGGMGAYCPYPEPFPNFLSIVERDVFEPAMRGFLNNDILYVGVLYAGLMLTDDGIKVLEFNCRFGDPETEVMLPLMQNDLYEIIQTCCEGSLCDVELKWKEGCSAVGVVMASGGYPERSEKGKIITGTDLVSEDSNQLLFSCGMIKDDNNDLVTNGGRVLVNVALAPTLPQATAKATKACQTIKFENAQYRTDIAHKGIARSILRSGNLSYKSSGVDITAGNNLVDYIKPLAKATTVKGVMGSLGGFGGCFDCKLAGFTDPVLVSGTDGVGTKLKIAQEMNIHDTIGIDLVAMCVNDVLAHGAQPLFFLDYFACGKLDISVAKEVLVGVAEGCVQANCALIGGETAEMPSVYPPGEYDLAGFTVGAVERTTKLLPLITDIKPGDVVIGLPSSGLHSNGISLVRKVIEQAGLDYKDFAPFSEDSNSYGSEFLRPTKIYVAPVLAAIKTKKVFGFAHITGGGLLENVPRILSNNLAVSLDAKKWKIPQIFGWLAATGGINEHELLRTFNCGIGGVLIVQNGFEDEILKVTKAYDAVIIGKVQERENSDSSQVLISNFSNQMALLMRPYIPNIPALYLRPRKRVAVLISGTGTNLQALINAVNNPAERINAEIILVISNKENVEGLNKAKNANISTKVIPHRSFSSRELFDDAIHAELISYNVEIVCLAGFMRILSKQFIQKWHGRLLNIHPSLLPSFKGADGVKQALKAGARVTGCTVHFVDEEVDNGAILVQESVPVHFDDTLESLQARIHTAEHFAYPKALKLLANEEVTLGKDNNIKYKI